MSQRDRWTISILVTVACLTFIGYMQSHASDSDTSMYQGRIAFLDALNGVEAPVLFTVFVIGGLLTSK
jgi:hypothetical protein